jgi:trans-AT polyketide synthase, acyltransferase and oxidoreductase domains
MTIDHDAPSLLVDGSPAIPSEYWSGPLDSIRFGPGEIAQALAALDRTCRVVAVGGRLGVTHEGNTIGPVREGDGDLRPRQIAVIGSLDPSRLGGGAFVRVHPVRYPYAAGAMANGIASETFVTALGRAGFLASFGSAGLCLTRIQTAIHGVRRELPDGPLAFNLIHTPDQPEREHQLVELYLRLGITVVEASAFMDLPSSLVYYRAARMSLDGSGRPVAGNHLIVKLSRREVAEHFVKPPPNGILRDLVSSGRITETQARAAASLPVADHVTVEADSGGHTDRQPLLCLLPSLLALCDDVQARYRYRQPIIVGAAGGLGTPAAIAAAFSLGAEYVVTGSINQACVEADTSTTVKAALANADMADVAMAPSADMFELGVQIQVLKRGTLFPMRAQKLYDLYRAHESVESIPPVERGLLERQIFRKSLDQVWQETAAYMQAHAPQVLSRALTSPKRRLALICRSYLGLSSDWAQSEEVERAMDFQIWCGPAMGAFNAWVAGSELAPLENRLAADIAVNLMRGAAYLLRLQNLRHQGIRVCGAAAGFRPRVLETVCRNWSVPRARCAAGSSVAPARLPAHSCVDTRPDARAIERWLIEQVARQIGISPGEIGTRQSFESFGLNSVQGGVILSRLERWLGEKLSSTLIWNYPTIEALAERLCLASCTY